MTAGALTLEVLCFRLGGILWGIEATQVVRIARPGEGVDARVLDPTRDLGVTPRDRGSGQRLVLRTGSGRAVLPVDEILEMVPLSGSEVAALPPLIAGALPEGRVWAVAKMGKEIALLLDGEALRGGDAPARGSAGGEEG